MIVVFCGKNPVDKSPVKIQHESALMQYLFEEIDKTNPRSKSHHITLLRESQSKDTPGNIRHFFSLADIRKIKKMNLFVSSNTFHLIRLSSIIHNILLEENGNLLRKVNSITLVGTESSFRPPAITHSDKYIKNLLLEVFQFLLTDHREMLFTK